MKTEILHNFFVKAANGKSNEKQPSDYTEKLYRCSTGLHTHLQQLLTLDIYIYACSLCSNVTIRTDFLEICPPISQAHSVLLSTLLCSICKSIKLREWMDGGKMDLNSKPKFASSHFYCYPDVLPTQQSR